MRVKYKKHNPAGADHPPAGLSGRYKSQKHQFGKTGLKHIPALFLAGFVSMLSAPSMAMDCTLPVEEIMEETGGELLSVSAEIQDGQAVCKVIILIEGRSGQRPRKISMIVPQ